jgi:endonuclease/exonuclease/phosphatase family metal-dependent hydrolase
MAHQSRILLSALAYSLWQVIRRLWQQGTALARASFDPAAQFDQDRRGGPDEYPASNREQHSRGYARMVFLNWNVLFGGGTSAALDLAGQLATDVVFLQEAFVTREWHGPVCGGQVPEQNWGSSVLVHGGTLEPIAVVGYTGWVVGARWLPERPDAPRAIYLFSVHSPTSPKGEPHKSYIGESLQIVRSICAEVPASAPLVIGGDFNFTSFGERLPIERPLNTRREREALTEFRSLGLSIAWRDAHPMLPLPQTLRWNNDPTVPFHCDGFLLRGRDGTADECDVLSSEAITNRSDHNPLVLRVRWGTA